MLNTNVKLENHTASEMIYKILVAFMCRKVDSRVLKNI